MPPHSATDAVLGSPDLLSLVLRPCVQPDPVSFGSIRLVCRAWKKACDEVVLRELKAGPRSVQGLSGPRDAPASPARKQLQLAQQLPYSPAGCPALQEVQLHKTLALAPGQLGVRPYSIARSALLRSLAGVEAADVQLVYTLLGSKHACGTVALNALVLQAMPALRQLTLALPARLAQHIPGWVIRAQPHCAPAAGLHLQNLAGTHLLASTAPKRPSALLTCRRTGSCPGPPTSPSWL